LVEVRFWSKALDREMSYFAYLPPGYATAGRRYPVLYLLHGASGSKEEWPAYGAIDAGDRLILSRDLRPLIMVMPQGDQGYWLNWANSGPRWGDYVSADLLSHVDANFRTLPAAIHRAIGGLSMGGHGALQLGFNHPDLFHGVGGHSPSLHVDDGTFPPAGTGPDFDVREPLALAQIAPGIEDLDIAIDAGDEDPWLDRVEALHQVLMERRIRHSYAIPLGGHEGVYWQRNLVWYLQFYDSALQ
jgi:enterochelin esterase-like enzyme